MTVVILSNAFGAFCIDRNISDNRLHLEAEKVCIAIEGSEVAV